MRLFLGALTLSEQLTWVGQLGLEVECRNRAHILIDLLVFVEKHYAHHLCEHLHKFGLR